jgi:hypothetical protein
MPAHGVVNRYPSNLVAGSQDTTVVLKGQRGVRLAEDPSEGRHAVARPYSPVMTAFYNMNIIFHAFALHHKGRGFEKRRGFDRSPVYLQLPL